MRIIDSKFIIESKIKSDEILKEIEIIGRTAYKSEKKISKNSAINFVKRLIRLKHFSVIEHYSITVRVICDRGISHEIVRHRIASYTQESTRYCNYSKGSFGREITVIKPSFWDLSDPKDKQKYIIWKETLEEIENSYLKLLSLGATPQEARSVLPNSLKTEIVITMNLREWRHFFQLRTTKKAHPQMNEIALPLLNELKKRIPIIFDDI